MPVVDKCFYKLENEFSDIYVEIKIGEKSFGDGDSAEFEHPEDAPTIYEFNLIFQHDYTCHWANYKPDIEYHKYLEKIRLDFYREINDEIDYSGDKFEILNLLDDYLLRSTQLKEYYFDKDVSSGRVKTQVKSHKLIQYHYSNDKPISK